MSIPDAGICCLVEWFCDNWVEQHELEDSLVLSALKPQNRRKMQLSTPRISEDAASISVQQNRGLQTCIQN